MPPNNIHISSFLHIVFNTFKYHVFAPMGRFQLELIYLYFHRISITQLLFLSCRPFVVISTLSTGPMGVEVTSVTCCVGSDKNIISFFKNLITPEGKLLNDMQVI